MTWGRVVPAAAFALALLGAAAVLLLFRGGSGAVYATNFDKIGGVVDPGDLVEVRSSTTRVGVLVDEMAASSDVRARFVADMLVKSDAWWEARARKQLDLTTYKLAFMTAFYPKRQQMMLPADPEAIKIVFSAKATHHNYQGHEVVSRPYSILTHLVCSPGSSGLADDKFTKIGGSVSIGFKLPLDPLLVYQRSGYACADEDQFPHGSLDAESVDIYYDDTCTAGPAVSKDSECLYENSGCHCSQGAIDDCDTALQRSIGRVQMTMTFTRVDWDEELANSYEALNSYKTVNNNPNPNNPASWAGADLVGYMPALAHNWVVYRWFPSKSCETIECLSGQPGLGGWRKLLIFDSVHVNIGQKDLILGDVAYKAGDPTSFNQAALHNMYYWDSCHHHPHFSEYASYAYGSFQVGHKQGFCMQSTNRIVNSREVSLVSPFQNCSYQGISSGWADNYNGGIPCQWVDVTHTPAGGVSSNLTMVGNPSNWLCEGSVISNPDGTPQWQSTGQVTTSPPYSVGGLPIDVYKCATTPGALNNNVDSIPVALPPNGLGLLTSPCLTAGHVFGPKRDCEFNPITGGMMRQCTPGQSVSLTCNLPGGARAQVLRVCESSITLQTGTACRFNDDSTLANTVILPGANTPVQFKCPSYRDDTETGGFYALYSGPLYNADPNHPPTCSAN